MRNGVDVPNEPLEPWQPKLSIDSEWEVAGLQDSYIEWEAPSSCSSELRSSELRSSDLRSSELRSSRSQRETEVTEGESRGSRLASPLPVSAAVEWEEWHDFHDGKGAPLPQAHQEGLDTSLFRWSTRRSHRLASQVARVITGDSTKGSDHCLGRLVLRPDSLRRMMWDVVSGVVLCYDVLQIPVELVFNRRDDVTLQLNRTTAIFWTLDMPCCFLTGFHHAGLVEMRPKHIALNYIRKWFFLDLVIILCDWLFILLSLQRGGHVIQLVRVAKATRLARIIRAVRILRFAKFYRILTDFALQIKSEQVRTILSIVVMITCIVFSNHYIACGWYWLGTQDGKTWLGRNNAFAGTTDVYLYTTALHWSLTQFTPASMDVSATNTSERIYSICVLLFALVTFTSFVSSITTSMTHLRKIRSEPERQEVILREYFYANQITAELGQRVMNFLWANHFSIKKRVHEEDITILTLLPNYLRWKIREELFQPVITRLPFIAEYFLWNATGVQEVCHHALQEVSLMSGDELFSRGKVAEKIFFVTGGALEYQHSVHALCATVREKHWACESALWFKWFHVGRLVAKTTVEVSALDVRSFRETMMKYTCGFEFVLSYKKNFHACMAMQPRSDLASMPGGVLRSVLREVRMHHSITSAPS